MKNKFFLQKLTDELLRRKKRLWKLIPQPHYILADACENRTHPGRS